MTTVAISGTTGLIGRAVADRMAADYEIAVIGRDAKAAIRADFSITGSLKELDLGGIDAVVHCASITNEDFAEDPERAYRHAILGMRAFAVRALDCGVRHVAYISSAHIYGHFVGRIDEASPPNPLTDYAIAHYASEQILRHVYRKGAAVLRPCAVFGIPPDLERFRRWNLIPFGFPKAALETGMIALKSNGRARRNFVGAEDVAACVASWLKNRADSATFQAINTIGRTSMSIIDFARLCADICKETTGKPCAVTAIDDPASPEEPFNYASNDSGNIGTTDLRATLTRLTATLASGLQRGAVP